MKIFPPTLNVKKFSFFFEIILIGQFEITYTIKIVDNK